MLTLATLPPSCLGDRTEVFRRDDTGYGNYLEALALDETEDRWFVSSAARIETIDRVTGAVATVASPEQGAGVPRCGQSGGLYDAQRRRLYYGSGSSVVVVDVVTGDRVVASR